MTTRAGAAVRRQEETGRDDGREPRGEQSSLLSRRLGFQELDGHPLIG